MDPHWASDPSGRFQYRWWNGARWTAHVANGDEVAVDVTDPNPVGRRTGSSRWIIAAAIVGGLAFLGLSGAGMWAYMNHDRLELIDRPDVAERAEGACLELDQQLAGLPPLEGTLPPAELAARISVENEAVKNFVTQVRSVGEAALRDDNPSEAWLADWEHLLRERGRYASALTSSPSPQAPRVPRSDDVPITDRMNKVGLTCSIPKPILDDFAG